MTREEAIHILDNLKPTNTKSSFDAYVVGKAITMAIKALEQNESAEEWYKLFVEKLEQEPKWIPVSERLPEDSERVLVCDRTTEYIANRQDNWWYFEPAEIALCVAQSDIIAWMPLPKPYEPQESEETDADSD